jgi:hypothetical protein
VALDHVIGVRIPASQPNNRFDDNHLKQFLRDALINRLRHVVGPAIADGYLIVFNGLAEYHEQLGVFPETGMRHAGAFSIASTASGHSKRGSFTNHRR